MNIVIGIDAGISSTKIVGIEDNKRIKSPMSVKGDDHISSIYGALGKYIHNNGIDLDEIEQVVITGVGSNEIGGSILGLPASHVDEFTANGLGARFDSGLDHIIVVSMGTGTSLVRVDGDEIKHIGGIGMGGGTLQGLSHLLLQTSDIAEVNLMAECGDAATVNLNVGDISRGRIEGLRDTTTASLFAQAVQNSPSRNDIAAGLIHMVIETIGSCAVLSQLNGGFKDFVLIGNITRLTACQQIFADLADLYQVRFHIPKYAYYCTALGAALSYRFENE